MSRVLRQASGSGGGNWESLLAGAAALGLALGLWVHPVPFADAADQPCEPGTTCTAPPQRRIISVADLHGDFVHTCQILQSLGIMGEDGAWTGGNTVLIQTGDVTDRGDESGLIYRALFRLQDEAPKSGGEVILLLGNHELMNMQGDFRYATRGDSESLGVITSAVAPLHCVRDARCFGKWVTRRSGGRKEAFSPEGWLGQGLRRRFKVVAVIGPEHGLQHPVVYVHAGILPQLLDQVGASSTDSTAEVVEKINASFLKLLAGNEASIRKFNTPLFGDDGPVWTRRFALFNDERTVCKELQRSLNTIGADRMVVGHTAQSDGKIHHRCGGRFILADTYISQAYTGVSHPSALEVAQNGRATALYPGTDLKFEQLPSPWTTAGS